MDVARKKNDNYAVIQPSLNSPTISPTLPQVTHQEQFLHHGQFKPACLRASLVGFKDGIPGTFSGLTTTEESINHDDLAAPGSSAENIRSSIKGKKNPFYLPNGDFTVVRQGVMIRGE